MKLLSYASDVQFQGSSNSTFLAFVRSYAVLQKISKREQELSPNWDGQWPEDGGFQKLLNSIN